MKLTILGCWAPYPRAGGACSGYLVQAGGKNILLDCGNGVMSNLLKHLDFRQLDAVVISHLHPDHYMDLHCLRHAVGGTRRAGGAMQPLPLYLPGQPAETFQQLSRFTEAFEVRAVETLPQSDLNGIKAYQTSLGAVRISFVSAEHAMPAYACRIQDESKALFFSSDTKWSESLATAATGVDLMLCEASVSEEDKAYAEVGHLTGGEAGRLAARAGAGNLMITHFWPEYNLDTIRAEAERGFGRPVQAALEGLEYNLEG